MSVNKVILLGNVGQDPKVTYYDGGACVAQVSFATSEKGYTLQNGTQIPDRTEWHNLVFRNRLAEIVDQYVHKGDKLYVEGKIRSRSYDDQAGVKRYVTEILWTTWRCFRLETPQRLQLHNSPSNQLHLRQLLFRITRRMICRSNCLTKTRFFGPRRFFMPVGRRI